MRKAATIRPVQSEPKKEIELGIAYVLFIDLVGYSKLVTAEQHRLEENIGAAAIELTANDLREIDSAASKITVQGAHYPETLEQMTGR